MHFDQVDGDLEFTSCTFTRKFMRKLNNYYIYLQPHTSNYQSPIQLCPPNTHNNTILFRSVHTVFQRTHFSRLVWSILHTNLKVYYCFLWKLDLLYAKRPQFCHLSWHLNLGFVWVWVQKRTSKRHAFRQDWTRYWEFSNSQTHTWGDLK